MTFAFSHLGFSACKSEVKPLEGEKWYGALTRMGHDMPFADNTKLVDLAKNHDSNQGAPLLLSSKGRFIWSERPFKFQFRDGVLHLESESETLKPVQAGNTLREAYMTASAKYFAPDGKVPPSIFFDKPQYNTWIALHYDQTQKDVLAYANAIVANGFPTGLMMVDDGWETFYGLFRFNREYFPDVKALNNKLRQMGFRTIYWISPFTAPTGRDFKSHRSEGILVRNGKQPAVISWWNGFSVAYDTTNPKARQYLIKTLKNLQEECGIDGFKFDGADAHHFQSPKLIFSQKGATAADYTQGWSSIGLEFPYNEFRASWKMGGKCLVQRLQDKNYSWEDLRELIPDMLAAGLIGYSYTCPDMIAGGAYGTLAHLNKDNIDKEFFVRSCQVHALMPMMQFSLEPWKVLDKKHLDIVLNMVRLHEKFAPYILEYAKKASQTGEPIVRHMEYAFPNEGFENCLDQFMLGEDYLVAPILQKGNKRVVRLPKGKWIDDLGVVREGGKSYEIDAPIERLPYFKKM